MTKRENSFPLLAENGTIALLFDIIAYKNGGKKHIIST
jgi:hypothetical protein